MFIEMKAIYRGYNQRCGCHPFLRGMEFLFMMAKVQQNSL